MRIALVISALGRGGAERQLMRLAFGLESLGEQVEVWCYGGATELDDELREKGIVVRNASGLRFGKIGILRRWVREFAPDIVHAFMKRASSLSVLARGIRRWPVIIGSDLSTATYGKRNMTLWISLFLFGFAQCVATQTELNRLSLQRLAPWLRGKVKVIRNGLDLAKFTPADSFPPEAPFRFIAVGSVYGLKNPIRLVDAIALLRDQGHTDFVVDWYGRYGLKGDHQPSDTYLECIRRIKVLNLGKVFRFRGETNEINAAYQDAHALIHPSIQEGFPNAVVEGMACALPIVVSRVSDLPLVVNEARNGYVFDETQPSSIAAGMSSMLATSRKKRAAMGRRSRELVESWFGQDRFVAEYRALYSELLQAQ